jgi:hypothetical protein
LKDAGAGNGSDNVHQLETPESSVHRVPMPWMKTNNNSLVTPESDSLASSVVKGSGVGVSEENTRKAAPYSDVVCGFFSHCCFVRSSI